MFKTNKINTILAVALSLVLAIGITFAQTTIEQKAMKNAQVRLDKEPSYDMNELQSRVKYPKEAGKKGIEGTVFVKVLISKDGNVKKCKVEKSDSKMLTKSAVTAIKQTKFTPGMRDGKAVEAWVVIPVKYKLK